MRSRSLLILSTATTKRKSLANSVIADDDVIDQRPDAEYLSLGAVKLETQHVGRVVLVKASLGCSDGRVVKLALGTESQRWQVMLRLRSEKC